MGFYEDAAATTTRMLREFGRTMFIERTSGTANPVASRLLDEETETLQTVGVRTSLTRNYVATSDVFDGDKLIVLDASQTPQLGDRIADGAEKWLIVQVDEINPAGVPVAYKVRVRK